MLRRGVVVVAAAVSLAKVSVNLKTILKLRYSSSRLSSYNIRSEPFESQKTYVLAAGIKQQNDDTNDDRMVIFDWFSSQPFKWQFWVGLFVLLVWRSNSLGPNQLVYIRT